ncbi:MAG: type II secretion system ATPase GspE [Myxococcota bacterium]|nr:type II secretion system ATPase GspE [Myxococcota bacterium]
MSSGMPQARTLREVLLESTRLNPAQLEEAEKRGEESGEGLAASVVDLGLLSEEEVLEVQARQLGLPLVSNLGPDEIDAELIERMPIAFAKGHGLLPISRTPVGALRVAVSNPYDTESLDDLRLLYDGAEIETVLTSKRRIVAAINQVYDRGGSSLDTVVEEASDDFESLATEISAEPQDLLDSDDDAPIIRLVDSLLQQAVKDRASDIHIEPFEKEIRVRFRVDDILYEPVEPLPRALYPSVSSRIKILGGVNIAEKRLPQDGRIRLKIAGRDYDVRLSTVPVANGERLVLRLLPRTTEMLDLERLGYTKKQLEHWETLISRPNGIILVTGPTGSGKTTTLYGSLSRINRPDRNIITIDDPVEIQLPGVGQIEVNHKIGLTFATALRSVLRQDPNVVLVGEIRDLETAEIAIQASLTGHLVFSTLHTNDAPSAITRLVDMGVESYLVGSSLVAVLAQRLVRMLCPRCRQAYEPTPEALAEIGVRVEGNARAFKPVGCSQCHDTGYRGRIGIFELMVVDDALRELASQNVDAKRIKHAAVQRGMNTLRTDGARKVLEGLTSIEEVLRATEDEGVVAQI